MTSFDLSRITRETGVQHVEYHESLDSTNKLAREVLTDLLPLCPALVLTSNQTAGRGRGANTWWATSGALTFSLVLNAADLELSPDRLPLISLATGLAVRNTIAALVPGSSVTVKWPNDVLVGGAKVCGILTEQHAIDRRSALVLGVGINMNNSLAPAPEDVRQRATSVFDLCDQHHDLTGTLIRLLPQIDSTINNLRSRQTALLAELNSHSYLNGLTVSLQMGQSTTNGLCRGIDDSGCLVIDDGDTIHRFNAGTVTNWQ
jgi:BirA family transcriptional regulator, biotin operon repressor / biotin---[acetyl-CoA-carboxylase] ligase